MAFPPNQQANTGLYIPTTNVWDMAKLYSVDVTSPEFKELLVRLYQTINNVAIAVNNKDSALYLQEEFTNGQSWFNTASLNPLDLRGNFRKVINFGALPNTATKSVAHGVTVNASFSGTRIYGVATDPVTFSEIPIPYSSPVLANNIELNVDGTNVNITTGSNRTNYTICYVVWEYLKS